MEKPLFCWRVWAKGVSPFNQFTGKDEILFKEVEKIMDKLERFRIESDVGEYYEVDFREKGKAIIDINGKEKKVIKCHSPKLIFSRRNKVVIESGKTKSKTTLFRIGVKTPKKEFVVEIYPESKRVIFLNDSKVTEIIFK